MAKANRSVTYSKATIDKENGVIVEILKDEERVYKLDSILTEWDGIKGITLSIKKDEELPSEE